MIDQGQDNGQSTRQKIVENTVRKYLYFFVNQQRAES